ncbi:MAG: TnpV protein [Clostridia bacterium]|nr:TnpV protein [Clostridia bacterium]
MTLTYKQTGDYLIPDLKAPESPKVGKYGMLRHQYLRQNKRAIFTGLQISGKLNSHLEQIDKEATERVETLVKQMAKEQNVNEERKATDQMKWVQMMNSLRASAEEIVLNELIYS